jgi:hypothetical protein
MDETCSVQEDKEEMVGRFCFCPCFMFLFWFRFQEVSVDVMRMLG